MDTGSPVPEKTSSRALVDSRDNPAPVPLCGTGAARRAGARRLGCRPKGMNETAGLGCLVGGGNPARQRNEPTILPNVPSNNT